MRKNRGLKLRFNILPSSLITLYAVSKLDLDITTQNYEIMTKTFQITDVFIFMDKLFHKVNRRILTLLSTDLYTRELYEIVQFILWECILFINEIYDLRLKIGFSSNTRSTRLEFYIYRHMSIPLYKYSSDQHKLSGKILVIFRTHKTLFSRIFYELVSDIKLLAQESDQEIFGCITDFENWQFISCIRSECSYRIKKFDLITFATAMTPDEEIFDVLVYTILDIFLRVHYYKLTDI